MIRRAAAKMVLLLAALAAGGPAAITAAAGEAAESVEPLEFDPAKPLISAPAEAARWPAFRHSLVRWRAEAAARLDYDDALYRRPEFAWSASNYACAFVMMCDELFYDWRRGQYTIDAFLDEGLEQFGGYDSLVLWHAYPRIGLDDRNQFDFYRDMPGGLTGLREVVRRCHQRGVRVFVNGSSGVTCSTRSRGGARITPPNCIRPG